MTWTKLPDDYGQSSPVVSLSDNAYRLYTQGLVYCNRHLTDGYIVTAAVGTLMTRVGPKSAGELIAAQLWRREPGGYLVVHFLDNQFLKAEVEQRRRERSAAGRLGGLRSGEVRRGGPLQSNSEASAEANAEANAKHLPTPSPSPSPSPKRTTRSLTRPEDARTVGVRQIGPAVFEVTRRLRHEADEYEDVPGVAPVLDGHSSGVPQLTPQAGKGHLSPGGHDPRDATAFDAVTAGTSELDAVRGDMSALEALLRDEDLTGLQL